MDQLSERVQRVRIGSGARWAGRSRRRARRPRAAARRDADHGRAAGQLLGIGWPTDQKAEWTIQFETDGPPAEVKVADGDASATPPEPPQPETLARTMRRWHDGTDMGIVWQIVIFLGGIIPALLSVTGIIIWWRARKARRTRAALIPATA